jgi:hypothetical protein
VNLGKESDQVPRVRKYDSCGIKEDFNNSVLSGTRRKERGRDGMGKLPFPLPFLIIIDS